MRTIKCPAIFLAQFMGDKLPFDTLEGMCTWMASLGYKGVQIPSWDARSLASKSLDVAVLNPILRVTALDFC